VFLFRSLLGDEGMSIHLPFKIELWDDGDRHTNRHIQQVIALTSDFSTASSAYAEAVKRRPGKLITLQARVIKKSR
jgi:hypothetical protein